MQNRGKARTTRFWLGFWRLADPKISLASLSSIFLGACAAAASNRDWSVAWLGVVVAAIYSIEVAKNASGEVFDFDSGVDQAVTDDDRSPFSGGKRVLVEEILSRKQTIAVSVLGFAAGIGLGLFTVLVRTPQVLLFGLFGIACAFFYHAPPVKLAYRGLGEVAVAICYGPLICVGTYFVLTLRLNSVPLLLSIPLGLLIADFLILNEFPDFRADESCGKQTLVVRWGRIRASRFFALLVCLAFALQAALPLAGLTSRVWLGQIALAPALFSSYTLLRHRDDETGTLIPAQIASLASFVLYSLGTGLGILLG